MSNGNGRPEVDGNEDGDEGGDEAGEGEDEFTPMREIRIYLPEAKRQSQAAFSLAPPFDLYFHAANTDHIVLGNLRLSLI